LMILDVGDGGETREYVQWGDLEGGADMRDYHWT
jgi:hypothetical protein